MPKRPFQKLSAWAMIALEITKLEKIGDQVGGQKWFRKESNVFLVGEK